MKILSMKNIELKIGKRFKYFGGIVVGWSFWWDCVECFYFKSRKFLRIS